MLHTSQFLWGDMDKTWVHVVNLLVFQFSRGVWNPTWANVPGATSAEHDSDSQSDADAQAERENDSASDDSSVVDNSQDSIVRDELEGRANGSVSHDDEDSAIDQEDDAGKLYLYLFSCQALN
jgi:hypothetical protein